MSDLYVCGCGELTRGDCPACGSTPHPQDAAAREPVSDYNPLNHLSPLIPEDREILKYIDALRAQLAAANERADELDRGATELAEIVVGSGARNIELEAQLAAAEQAKAQAVRLLRQAYGNLDAQRNGALLKAIDALLNPK